MSTTSIDWAINPDGTRGKSWNPITGCTKVSEGCRNCYAERMARRLAGRCGYPQAPHHFDVTFHPDRLEEPLRWKKPSVIFTCSMSDLGHTDINIPDAERVWKVMNDASWHTFLVLTKRPMELGGLLHWWGYVPPDHVWLGVSVESPEYILRIRTLLQTSGAYKWVSLEPLLEWVDIRPWIDGLGWLVLGCESGPRRRPMQLEWAMDVVRQCADAGVPCFVKQIEVTVNGKCTVSHDPAEWPEALRVRQLPWVVGG
jgi:protein gp37